MILSIMDGTSAGVGAGDTHHLTTVQAGVTTLVTATPVGDMDQDTVTAVVAGTNLAIVRVADQVHMTDIIQELVQTDTQALLVQEVVA